MISGKDVRVENGNIIINGEKSPIVQDVSDLEEDVEALSETVGDSTSGLVKDVDDLDDRVTTLEGAAISYKDVTIDTNTTGHGAPVVSAGGVCFEPLVSLSVLELTADQILNMFPIGWSSITKPFTLYLRDSGLDIAAFSSSNTSIYASSGNLTLRVVYKN